MAIEDLKESLGIDEDSTAEIRSGLNSLDKSTKKFRKGLKEPKSVIGAAKQNMFEFPVFISSSVPLDYATATASLLEQVYASFLQMAISTNPVISEKSAMNGTQFAHLKSDTNKYLECVDTTYQQDACYNRIDLGYTMDGEKFLEFSLISIDDGDARVINEQCDYQPLSEFDHFFQEAVKKKPPEPKDFNEARKMLGQERRRNEGLQEKAVANMRLKGENRDLARRAAAAEKRAEQNVALIDNLTKQLEDMKNVRVNKAQAMGSISGDVDADQYDIDTYLQELSKLREEQKKATADAKIAAHNALDNIIAQEDRMRDLDEQIKKAQKERNPEELAKLKAERELAQKKLEDYEDDHRRAQDKIKAETDKLNAEIRNIANKYNLDLKAAEREAEKYEYEKSRRRADELDAANRGRVRAAQFMDETKIQKLNTMKPLMMTVDMNVEGKDGRIVQGVEYIVGVKCHARLVDASTLPEVVEYPLKEMNKITRKAKWRAGELKFFKDILFKIPQKKQTAIDSRDPKRKWYRRLYELAHIKGDAPAKAVINGDSVIKAFFKDKLGQYGDTSGVIPNAALIISKADVDVIKRATNIDMLKGSTAAKFCKELFMIGIIVIDNDAESIKVLLPDLHNDYEVHSLGSVNKQLAMLDTSGTKTRDMFKLLG